MSDVTPEPAEAARAAIRHWSDKAALARFAADRHGFGDTDGGFGVTYPSDVDEGERGADGTAIPDGHVLVYGFWADDAGGYDVLVPERLYLRILAEELDRLGLSREAAAVRSLVGDRGNG